MVVDSTKGVVYEVVVLEVVVEGIVGVVLEVVVVGAVVCSGCLFVRP